MLRWIIPFLMIVLASCSGTQAGAQCPPGFVCVKATPTRTGSITRTPTRTRVPTRTATRTRTRTPVVPPTVVPTTSAPTVVPPTGEPVCSPGFVNFYGKCQKFTLYTQPSFKESMRGMVTASTSYHTSSMAIDRSVKPNAVLLIDKANNRLKRWNGIGVCSVSGAKCNHTDECLTQGETCIRGRDPDKVAGQPSFGLGACNHDDNLGRFGPAACDSFCFMQTPDGTNRSEQWATLNISVGPNGHAYVPDAFNHRVVELDRDLKTVLVRGQDNCQDNLPNRGFANPSRDSMRLAAYPAVSFGGTAVDSKNRLYVADTGNGRLTRFEPGSTIPTLLLGQKSWDVFDGSQCASGSHRLDLLCQPYSIAIGANDEELYVLDAISHSGMARLVVYRVDPVTGDFVSGQSAWREVRPTPPTGGGYFFSAMSVAYAPQTSGPFAGADLRIVEFWPGRRIAYMDTFGNYIGVMNSDSITKRGGSDWCDSHQGGPCAACMYATGRFHWPSGTADTDDHGFLYVADDDQNHWGMFDVANYKVTPDGCIPPPVFVSRGAQSAIVGERITGEPAGAIIDEQNLTLYSRNAENTLLAYDDYRNRTSPATARIVKGHFAGRGSFAIDSRQWLWTANQHAQLYVYQLPIVGEVANPMVKDLRLVWDIDGTPLPYAAWTVAWHSEHGLWVAGDTRLMHLKDPENAPSGTVRVDRVLGVNSKEFKCNRGNALPDQTSICQVVNIAFDALGNLYVVDNNYECHVNDRVVVFSAQSLRTATGTFPMLKAARLLDRRFSQDFTAPTQCASGIADKDRPFSPVVVIPYLAGVLIGNDGYGVNEKTRVWRQWFYYQSPFTKASPDYVVLLRMGAPGGGACDSHGGCALLDHTWQSLWYIPDMESWMEKLTFP